MADTDVAAETAALTPAAPPKEKKKKRSVKSDKSSKSVAAAATTPTVHTAEVSEISPCDASLPQQNGLPPKSNEVIRAVAPDSLARELRATAPDPLGRELRPISADSLARELAPGISDDPAILSILKTPLKFIVAGEAGVPEPVFNEDGQEIEPRKVSWTEETDELNQIDDAEAKAREKKHQMEEEKIRELAEAFYLLDFNQDGLICKKDLQMTFSSLGRADMPDSEIQHMLDEADSPLDFESFVKLLGNKTVDLDTEETLVKALAQWDKEGTGLISEPAIRHDLMTWGDKFSEQEVDYALEDAPLYAIEESGLMLDYVEFCKALCGLSANE